MKTVIYARYSSTLQNSRSIEDQIAVCRDRAEREGWEIVGVFPDYAISGAAGIDEGQRPGLNAMLAAVKRGGIDQVLAEATDRIARHQGDSFAIRERLEYAGCRLFTLSDGQVDDITGTIKGLFDARFRKELAAKIKRGQRGTVGQGRSPAGRAYGYRVANRLQPDGKLLRGLREIDVDQAEIVRRIFREYDAGQSPRAIAQRLNSERIPAPAGATWRTSTINGDRQRQNGMLQNQLYVGVMVHNRTSKVTDPRSRKVRIRPNPASEWISAAVPELRIIEQDVWERVQARRTQPTLRPETMRRPKHLLSGLAVCAICGGGWTAKSNGYWGCGRWRDGRGCTNNRSIQIERMERRVLDGLQTKLLDPDLISIFVAEYHRGAVKRSGELKQERARLDRRLSDANAKLSRLVDLVAGGAGDFEEFRTALVVTRSERDQLAHAIAEMEALPVIALHPKVVDDYRAQVGSLTAALTINPESKMEVLPQLRSLIDRVIVRPSAQPKGVDIEVKGKLAAILAMASGKPICDHLPVTVTLERVKGIEPSS